MSQQEQTVAEPAKQRGLSIDAWAVLLAFGLLSGFRVAYLAGLFVILFSLLLEHWLARWRSLKWINVAFFRLNALISLVFLIIVMAEIVFPHFNFGR